MSTVGTTDEEPGMAVRRAPVVSSEQRSWTRGSTPSDRYFADARRAARSSAASRIAALLTVVPPTG